MESGPARPASAAPAPGHGDGETLPRPGLHLLRSVFDAGTVFLRSPFSLTVSSLRGDHGAFILGPDTGLVRGWLLGQSLEWAPESANPRPSALTAPPARAPFLALRYLFRAPDFLGLCSQPSVSPSQKLAKNINFRGFAGRIRLKCS